MKNFIVFTVLLILYLPSAKGESSFSQLSGLSYNYIIIRNMSDFYVIDKLDRNIFHKNNHTIDISSDSSKYNGAVKLFFLDSLYGNNLDRNYNLFCTEDGGKNWVKKFSFFESFNAKVGTVQFLNHDFGYVAGSIDKNLFFFRTTNGGLSWENIKLTDITSYSYIKFFSQDDGIIFANNNRIFRTTNGGYDWFLYATSPVDFVYDLDFINLNLGNLATKYNLYHTTDGGKTWSITYNSSYYFSSLSFVDDKLGWAAGSGGIILKTSDAGATWENISNPDLFEWVNAIKFFDKNNGVRAGDFGTVFTTDDGGKNWDFLQRGTRFNINDIMFTDENVGFACGDNNILLKSTDKGLTWSQAFDFSTNNLLNLANYDKNYLWVGGENGILYRSTDGGNNWTKSILQANKRISNIVFKDANNGFALNGSLFVTSNGGEKWDLMSNNIKNINDVEFKNNTGWILCRLDTIINQDTIMKITIYKSENNGIDWSLNKEQIEKYTNSSLMNMTFLDEMNGFIKISSNKILNTSNGGLTWNEIIINNSLYFNKMKFLSLTNGWAVGSSGNISFTSDGGKNWIVKKSIKNKILSGISILNDSLIYFCGDLGTIIQYSNGQFLNYPTSIKENQASNFLSIYPNPTNSYIRIDDTELEDICIFNYLGEQQTNFSITNNLINVNNLDNGIYFIKIGDKVAKFVKI